MRLPSSVLTVEPAVVPATPCPHLPLLVAGAPGPVEPVTCACDPNDVGMGHADDCPEFVRTAITYTRPAAPVPPPVVTVGQPSGDSGEFDALKAGSRLVALDGVPLSSRGAVVAALRDAHAAGQATRDALLGRASVLIAGLRDRARHRETAADERVLNAWLSEYRTTTKGGGS